MKKRYIIIPAACITLLFLVFLALRFITTFSGSHHYAEWYIFEEPRDSLIADVTDFKNQNPDYKFMILSESGQIEEFPDRYVNYYYACTFYLKDKKTALNCVIAGNDSISSIGLVSINKKYSNTARLVNKELDRNENTEVKELFETEILDKLGKWQYKPKSWSDYIK